MPNDDHRDPSRRPAAEPEFWEPVEPDIPALHSRAREVIGRPVRGDDDVAIDPDSTPQPPTLLEFDETRQGCRVAGGPGCDLCVDRTVRITRPGRPADEVAKCFVCSP